MITNDFTKKELLALEDAMQNMLELHRPQSGESHLLNKLQSMIDNYCDHNWQEGEYLFSDTFCTKCHKSLNNEGDKEPIND